VRMKPLRNIRLNGILALAIIWAGAVSHGLSQSIPAPAAKAASVPDEDQNYRLIPGDIIDVRPFFNPELTEQVQIRPDGRISLHLIGEVDVAGKTVRDAMTLLDQRYAKELKTPEVTIQVRSFASQKAYVTGEVVRPGVVSIPGAMTVFEAISEAGGIKHTGNEKAVVLIRKGPDGKPQGRHLVLFEKGELTDAAGMRLRPFDVVIVPESKIAHVDRWIDQHIRQLIPVNSSAGFTYLISKQQGGIPVF